METDQERDERFKLMLFNGAPIPEGWRLPALAAPPARSDPEALRRTAEEAAALKSARFRSWDSQPFPQPSDEKLGVTTGMATPSREGSWQDLSEGGKVYTMEHWVNWKGVSTKDRAAMIVEQVDVERLLPSLKRRLMEDVGEREASARERDQIDARPTQAPESCHSHKPRMRLGR
jgi:hypothetical protein